MQNSSSVSKQPALKAKLIISEDFYNAYNKELNGIKFKLNFIIIYFRINFF